MSRDSTWVVNPCTKFELDRTNRSRDRTTTIFHWPPALSHNFYVLGVKVVKFQISSFWSRQAPHAPCRTSRQAWQALHTIHFRGYATVWTGWTFQPHFSRVVSEIDANSELWICFNLRNNFCPDVRVRYCFFVIRHVGTSAARHARHVMSWHDVVVRVVTQQVEFGLGHQIHVMWLWDRHLLTLSSGHITGLRDLQTCLFEVHTSLHYWNTLLYNGPVAKQPSLACQPLLTATVTITGKYIFFA